MLLVVVLVIETLLAIVKKERIRAKRNDAALHAEAAAGRVLTHIFFHPDYTVGPGFSPGLLTLHGRRSRARP
jgi:hypothetical protein